MVYNSFLPGHLASQFSTQLCNAVNPQFKRYFVLNFFKGWAFRLNQKSGKTTANQIIETGAKISCSGK